MKAPVKILAGLVVAFGVSSATFALAGERGEPSVIRLQQGFSGVCEACDLRERDFSNALDIVPSPPQTISLSAAPATQRSMAKAISSAPTHAISQSIWLFFM